MMNRDLVAKLGAVALTVIVAGCAHHAVAPPATVPATPVPSWTPSKPAAPSAVDADEAFHGVHFGASRADVLRAYPAATCTAQQCTGATQLYGIPATFLVFGQPDGRWAARLSMTESTAPGANFNHVNDGLSARYRHEEVVIEDDGNRYRWHPEAARPRQIVLRRCGISKTCNDIGRGVIEVAYFEQGTPLGHPW